MYILIIYYSGVGNTKLVAHKIFRMLKTKCEVDIISIEHMSHIISLEKYDAFVIGFPTIHASPAIPITEFIEKLMPLHSKKPSLIFTTCGLYSANTLRIFSKKCVIKNILPIITASYRCSATDGMLIAPYMNVWFRHDKKLDEKIEKSINDFLYLLKGTIKYRLPRFKIYSILNYPNKYLGEKLVSRIYIHNTYCTLC